LKRIYVGNLSYQTTEESLQAAFAEYGTVSSVSIIRDRGTGQSRGFAFVEMDNDEEANAAIEALNGAQFEGRTLTVNIARPRTSGGGGRRFGGRGART